MIPVFLHCLSFPNDFPSALLLHTPEPRALLYLKHHTPHSLRATLAGSHGTEARHLATLLRNLSESLEIPASRIQIDLPDEPLAFLPQTLWAYLPAPFMPDNRPFLQALDLRSINFYQKDQTIQNAAKVFLDLARNAWPNVEHPAAPPSSLALLRKKLPGPLGPGKAGPVFTSPPIIIKYDNAQDYKCLHDPKHQPSTLEEWERHTASLKAVRPPLPVKHLDTSAFLRWLAANKKKLSLETQHQFLAQTG